MAKKIPTDKNKTYTPRIIKQDFYASVSVDILIPFYGQYKKVGDLCRSLWKTLGLYHNYNICLIDDASPNNYFIEGFRNAPRTTLIQNAIRLGFGGALNVGFNQTNRDFVLIMHSDCVAEGHSWLKELFKTLFTLRNKKVVMVSPMTNNPGTGPDCLKMKKNEFLNRKPQKDFILEEGCLPLYCALAPREIFGRINGFVKPYPIGWYEDEELSYRIRASGHKLGVAVNSWINHVGAATVNDILRDEPTAKDIMENNRQKCIEDMRKLGPLKK